MPVLTHLPPTHPPNYTPTHHINAPPTSFRNPWPSFNTANHTPAAFLKAKFGSSRPSFIPVPARSELVPVRVPTWGAGQAGCKVTWIGHASFMIETTPSSTNAARGIRILCDPVFSERTSPVSFLGPKRYSSTPCPLSDLPDVDIVLISHSHYDHCDLPTLTALYARHKSAIHFLAGLNSAAWFHSIGIPPAQVTELDWWDAVSVAVPGVGGVKLICTPSQHASKRGAFDTNKLLWCSWLIEEEFPSSASANPTEEPPIPKRIFFAGDTGYRSVPSTTPSTPESELAYPHNPTFTQIASLLSSNNPNLNPITLSLLPIGLCTPRPLMSPVHANPTDSIHMHKDLHSARSVGMHWGTVRGGISQEYEDVRDPPRWWREAAEREGLKWRKARCGRLDGGGKGEVVDVEDHEDDEDWEIGLMDVGETLVLK